MRLFAGSYAPQGWLPCEGQLLAINDYQELYQLLGNTYGGDPGATFALPDMRGRVPVGVTYFPGVQPERIGLALGTETVTLTPDQLPAHSHSLSASSAPATENSPEGNSFATTASNVLLYPDSNKPTVAPRAFSQLSISSATGPAQPHDNMMPTTAIGYIIAVAGIFPDHG
jgi:microcystin-dependent protein